MGPLPGQCAGGMYNHDQVQVCLTSPGQVGSHWQPLLVLGIPIQRHQQLPAAKGGRDTILRRLNEQYRGTAQPYYLLGDAAKQPVA